MPDDDWLWSSINWVLVCTGADRRMALVRITAGLLGIIAPFTSSSRRPRPLTAWMNGQLNM